MNSEDNKDKDELAQLWQTIETEPEVSAHQLQKLAKRSKMKNKLILLWDSLGCLIILYFLYLAIAKQASYLVITWIVLAIIFAVWLTVKFNRYRQEGERALSSTIANYKSYLVDKAKSNIKVGKLLNVSNLIMLLSMFVLVIADQWFAEKPMITEAKQWYFLIGWSVFWGGSLFFYGYWKINKGKKALKNLE